MHDMRDELYADCDDCGTMHPTDDLEPTERGHLCPDCYAEYEYLSENIDHVVVRRMVSDGFSDSEIAECLQISRASVWRIKTQVEM